ncbi:hypothetical protein [Sphingomonas sp.]|uniref:hypothetical protein n=1 Tax=Sphingomonas sp. TaxID=28214 RepID=UPI00286E70DE|nr:hypothetical protein [Sphingomonas sp.]
MTKRAARAACVAVLIAAGSSSALPSPPRPVGNTRADLQRHDLGAPGREVLQARVDFAPGSSFPRHKHPGGDHLRHHRQP